MFHAKSVCVCVPPTAKISDPLPKNSIPSADIAQRRHSQRQVFDVVDAGVSAILIVDPFDLKVLLADAAHTRHIQRLRRGQVGDVGHLRRLLRRRRRRRRRLLLSDLRLDTARQALRARAEFAQPGHRVVDRLARLEGELDGARKNETIFPSINNDNC